MTALALLPLAFAAAFAETPGHGIRFLASPPRGAVPPTGLLVCVAGAGADFAATLRPYEAARGDRPVLLVVPATFSNTNLLVGDALRRYRGVYTEDVIAEAAGTGVVPDPARRLAWDEAGVRAVVAHLRRRYPTVREAHLTGFSGGGFLCYRFALRSPETFSRVVPVCANFDGWNAHPAESASPMPGVSILYGERDALRRYRYGGDRLPGPWSLMGIVAAATAVGLARARRARRPARAMLAVAAAGAAMMLLVEAGRWSGTDRQTEAAVGVLWGRGADVSVECLKGSGHEDAPAEVMRRI